MSNREEKVATAENNIVISSSRLVIGAHNGWVIVVVVDEVEDSR